MSEGSGKAYGIGCLALAPVILVLALPLLLMLGNSAGATLPGPTGPPGGGPLNAHKVPHQYLALVESAGSLCRGVPPAAIAAQLDQESGWNPGVTSSAGAEGIAQFMPGTWASWGKDYDHNGTDSPFDPGDAIPAQGHMMCSLFAATSRLVKSGAAHGDPLHLAWAAYNAGLGAVEAAGGIPPIAQTQQYVARITQLMAEYSLAPTGGGTAVGVARAAETQLGLPYVWGGGDWNGPTGGGFDCSGLVMYAVAQATHMKVLLPHSSRADRTTSLLQAVPGISPGHTTGLEPGDIIVLNLPGSTDGSWGHVVIYVGGGNVIHAPYPGKNVEIAPLSVFNNAQWAVRRVPATDLGGK